MILKIYYEAAAAKLMQALPFLPIMFDRGVLFIIYVSMIVGGTILGMFGGYISVSRVLKSEV